MDDLRHRWWYSNDSNECVNVPQGNIRLFSPQLNFQEQNQGHAKIGAAGLSWTLTDEKILRFRYAGGSNIPIVLTKQSTMTTVGLTFHDLHPVTDTTAVSLYLSVSDETNALPERTLALALASGTY
jgi:hypothetical protein